MIKVKPIMKNNILGTHPKILINLNKYSINKEYISFFEYKSMKINIFIFYKN